MQTTYFKNMCALLLVAVLWCGCEGGGLNPKNAREAFVGDYTFVSTGDVDLYMGATKVITIPMDQKGEMTIALAEKSNAVWIIADNDSTLASVSENELFIEPTEEEVTMAGIDMQMSFTHSKATLVNKQLSWTSTMDITATYRSMSLSGKGQVDIVATRK